MESKKDTNYNIMTDENEEKIADFITQRVFNENEKISYREGMFTFSSKRT